MVLTCEVLHQVHGKVLVADVQNQVWSGLVDSLSYVGFVKKVVNLVSVTGVVLVH